MNYLIPNFDQLISTVVGECTRYAINELLSDVPLTGEDFRQEIAECLAYDVSITLADAPEHLLPCELCAAKITVWTWKAGLGSDGIFPAWSEFVNNPCSLEKCDHTEAHPCRRAESLSKKLKTLMATTKPVHPAVHKRLLAVMP